MMTRILLVDDHPVVRLGIRAILTDRIKGVVVGEAGDADALSDNCAARMGPGRRGYLTARYERSRSDQAPARSLAESADARAEHASCGAVRAASPRAGATGYLTKDSAPDDTGRGD